MKPTLRISPIDDVVPFRRPVIACVSFRPDGAAADGDLIASYD